MTEKQICLDEYLEKSIVRRYRVQGILENILGEHDVRVQKISTVVYAQMDRIEDEDLEKLKKSKTVRETIEEVHTFPRDEEGNLLIPLGGKHGYLYGALRVAMNDLFKDKLNDRKWKGYGLKTNIEHGIFITPDWIKAGKNFSNPKSKPKKFLVKTAGISQSIVNVYYDYIEKVPFELTIDITNEKIPEDIFLMMLAHVQRLGIGPKGRGRIRFTKVVKIK